MGCFGQLLFSGVGQFGPALFLLKLVTHKYLSLVKSQVRNDSVSVYHSDTRPVLSMLDL